MPHRLWTKFGKPGHSEKSAKCSFALNSIFGQLVCCLFFHPKYWAILPVNLLILIFAKQLKLKRSMAKTSSFYVKNNPKLINLPLECTGIKNLCEIIKIVNSFQKIPFQNEYRLFSLRSSHHFFNLGHLLIRSPCFN